MSLSLQIIAPLITCLCAVVFRITEILVPFFIPEQPGGRHDARNLTMAILNLIILIPAGLCIAQLPEHSIPFSRGIVTLLPGYFPHTVAALLLMDLWIYWWHRLNHEVPFLWRFHSVHHSDPQLNVTSAWRFHPGEIILSELLRPAILVLIGTRPEQLVIYTILMTPVIAFHHSNIRIPEPLDRLLRTLIPTPSAHRIHHSILTADHHSNYGAMLSVWDRMFGTWREKEVTPSLGIGLEGEEAPHNQSLRAMLARPFRSHPFSRVLNNS